MLQATSDVTRNNHKEKVDFNRGDGTTHTQLPETQPGAPELLDSCRLPMLGSNSVAGRSLGDLRQITWYCLLRWGTPYDHQVVP